jgi:hypothetical protein
MDLWLNLGLHYSSLSQHNEPVLTFLLTSDHRKKHQLQYSLVLEHGAELQYTKCNLLSKAFISCKASGVKSLNLPTPLSSMENTRLLLVLFLFPKSREYLIDYNFVCPRISFGSFTFTSLVLQATCSSTRLRLKSIFLLIF